MTTMMSNLSPKDFEHVFCLDIPTQTYNERIFRLVAAYHLLLYIMFFLIVSASKQYAVHFNLFIVANVICNH